MHKIGTQSKNVIVDSNPEQGFRRLKEAGFDYCDFSLNEYLKNKDIYNFEINKFFDSSVDELKKFFLPHKEGAEKTGIKINQMHMPYPIYVPKATAKINDYLINEVVPKSMEICKFLECNYIVIHGAKLRKLLGSEQLEWEKTQEILEQIVPFALENGITICIENLYNMDNYGRRMVEGPGCEIQKNVERIDEINSKYGGEVLGFCFDTGHANLTKLDFESFITKLGSRLKVLHVHDNDGVEDLHQLPFTFTKTRDNIPATDWDGFVKGLQNINFDGVLNFETAPTLSAFPDELKDECLKLIAKTGEYFWNKIKE